MKTTKIKNKRNTLLTIFLFVMICMLNASEIPTTKEYPQFYPVRDQMYTQSLNGTWKFKLISGLTIPSNCKTWIDNQFDDSSWDNIVVPGNWETQGFKLPEYGKDLEEYIGLYRTTFNFSPAWKNKHLILRFDGVHFGYECYVNGKKVGEWGSAYNMCQFDITPYIHEKGKNVLCVKVMTRSHGWMFDTNDCWSLTGISRDVELFTLDNLYLEDVTYTSEILPNWDAKIKVRVKVNRFREEKGNYRLNVALVDAQNNHVLDFSNAISTEKNEFIFENILSHPHLWTAETPYLYGLETTIVDEKGYVIQRNVERVGVRSVQIDGFDLKVNHRPVLLRGACLNEINPKSGKVFTYKERRQQLEMMKAANINFIRTAHYPFGPDFLDLCDEMGFYVCEEVPFGSRGNDNLRQGMDYFPELKARADATINRDKNHPSIIIWSLGNENPYTPVVEELLKYVKKKDITRPRGLPQKVGDFMKFAEHPSENVDVIMGHYLNDARIDQAIKNTTKPIIHTEYAHALGLAFGDFEARFNRILKEDKVIGGSIWCWSDQTIMTLGDNQKNDVLKSVWLDSLRFIDSYGRSKVAEGKVEVWKEAADGLVYGNGYPQEDYFMVRKVYSPVVIKDTILTGELGKENQFDLKIENRFDFISLNGYRLNWSLCNVKKILASGTIWLRAEARNQEVSTIKVALPSEVDFQDLMLCLECMAPNQTCIFDTSLPIVVGEKDYRSEFINQHEAGKLETTVSKDEVLIRTNQMRLSVTKKGQLSLSDSEGHLVAETPLLLRVGRPLTITLDYLTQKDKYYWTPYLLHPNVRKMNAQEKEDGVHVALDCRWYRNDNDRSQYLSGKVNLLVRPNGIIQLNYDIHPSSKAKGKLLECGITLEFNPTFDVFRWLGNGPYSSTPGKTAYNKRACWAMHKDDIRFTGNRGKVDVAALTGVDGKIGLWSDNGNIGIENVDGVIYVSQNAIVTGYGSKFTSPEGLQPIENLESIKGCLLLSVGDTNLLNTLFAPYSTITPEQPFMKGYGW